MNIALSPKNIFQINLYLILFLFSANFIGLIFRHYLGYDMVYGLVPLFDFNSEMNIPTFYSSIALIFSSCLLLFIAFTLKNSKSPSFSWFMLSLIFMFLSIDEISSIHERFSGTTKEAFDTSGLFHYAWIIPYGLALIAFVISYTKFLFLLPKKIMRLFLLSGFLFVFGAIGFEMLGGRQADLLGTDNVLYSFYYTCEESLEMLGIALFIYTLLIYIVDQFGPTTLTLTKFHLD